MRYKLYTENKYNTTEEQILCGRGFTPESAKEWLEADFNAVVSSWKDLGEDKIQKSIEIINEIVDKEQNILIVVDPDVDGFTSSAILINYLYKRFPEYTKQHVNYILHTGKQHGLADITIPEDINLVICPDSSSNDYEYHWKLNGRAIPVIILDHHEAPCISDAPLTVTINNQLCDYKNKDFSGAGIVWQFCRAWDDFNLDYMPIANEFLDLCALGNLSDMMLFTSIETKTVICEGLKNIQNPFFYYMVEKNNFSIQKKDGINYMSIAFYVTPFINAICRSGTMEEKELIFKSMLLMSAFEKVESGKRGHKGELVPLVEEAVRIATNVKTRQNKLQDESMALFENRIKEEGLNNNPIILLKCEPGEIEPNIAGLCANKIQAKYQRPTLLLTKVWDSEKSGYSYRGSGRNYSMSELQNFRELCDQTNCVEYAQGHEGAFGLGLEENMVEEFLSRIYQRYAGVPQEPIYWVDYIWNINEANGNIILDIANMSNYWGQGIPEAKVCLNRISLSSCKITLMSADKNPTIKITLPNGIDIIKFKSSQEEYENFCKSNAIFTAVCGCNKNEWNGRVSPQLLVEEFELTEEWVF